MNIDRIERVIMAMKTMKAASILVSLTAGALIAFIAFTASPSAMSRGQQAQGGAAEDPANELFVQMCNRCHDAARITALRRTKTEWEEVLNKMIERGATGSEEDFQTVFGFLRRHYGKVYINSATPEDITTTLRLSDKDAGAIVTYRKEHGAFADFDAVKKVPDIDVKRLEDHKDAVAF